MSTKPKRKSRTSSTLAKVKPADVLKHEVFGKVAKIFISIAAQHGRPILDTQHLAGAVEQVFQDFTDTKFGCNLCGDAFWDKNAMIEHYRHEHPREAFDLYGAIGTVGNNVADRALDQIYDRIYKRGLEIEAQQELMDHERKSAQRAKRKGGPVLVSAVREFRQKHPREPVGCYLLFGTIGDKFADQGLADLLAKRPYDVLGNIIDAVKRHDAGLEDRRCHRRRFSRAGNGLGAVAETEQPGD
jgi:hypothetical protein